MLDGHVHDNHLRALGNGVPVDGRWHQAGAIMPGQKGDRLIDVTVCHGNAGIGQTTNASRNSRNDPQPDTRLDKCLRFLTTTAKDEGIAAFQAQDALVLAGKLNQTVGNVALFR